MLRANIHLASALFILKTFNSAITTFNVLMSFYIKDTKIGIITRPLSIVTGSGMN